MSVVGVGVVELLIVMGFGGGMGLPLGIPPAPEDPLLAAVAPEDCLFYTSWAGIAEPDAQSGNQTEQLLAEGEVRHLIAEIKRRIKTGLRQAGGNEGSQQRQMLEDAMRWGEKLLTSPTAVFVSAVTPLPQPDVRAGAVVRVGEDAGQLETTLQTYQAAFLGRQGAVEEVQIDGDTWYRLTLDPNAPKVTWGVRKNYLIVGVGEGSVEGILERARTDPPAWLTDLGRQLPVERRSTVSYLNVKKIRRTLVPLAGGLKAAAVVNAIGLSNVDSLVSVTGLDAEGFVSRTLLAIDGEPQGLLALARTNPLVPDDLAAIPADATIALAARVDADAVFDTVLSVIEKVEPRASEEVTRELGQMQQALGINLRDDVLSSLGDAWCVYNSPGEGGLVITGLTAVVPVENHTRLLRVHERLLATARAEMGRNEDRGPRIEQLRFADEEIYFLNVRDEEFPLAPSWCLTEKVLLVAPFPQNIKSYLLRGAEHQSIASVAGVSELFGQEGGPLKFLYVDTPKLFELFYPLAPIFAQMATRELQREGIDVNVSLLPSAKAIGKHLRPTITAVRHTDAGIEVVNRQTVPGGNFGSALPVAVAVGLPAVHSARAAARRAAGMNNLKQLGLAMHVYHDQKNSFPPAYTTDDDGKPLLSWRVQILPYIEQEELYERFHHDEPWDSPHNRQLVALMPSLLKAPGENGAPGKTNYLTVRGEQTPFPGKEKIGIAGIADGSSNTILLVEVGDDEAVVWTKPDDYQYDEQDPAAGLRSGMRRNGFNAAFCDGSVRFITMPVDERRLSATFTRNGGETDTY